MLLYLLGEPQPRRASETFLPVDFHSVTSSRSSWIMGTVLEVMNAEIHKGERRQVPIPFHV